MPSTVTSALATAGEKNKLDSEPSQIQLITGSRMHLFIVVRRLANVDY